MPAETNYSVQNVAEPFTFAGAADQYSFLPIPKGFAVDEEPQLLFEPRPDDFAFPAESDVGNTELLTDLYLPLYEEGAVQAPAAAVQPPPVQIQPQAQEPQMVRVKQESELDPDFAPLLDDLSDEDWMSSAIDMPEFLDSLAENAPIEQYSGRFSASSGPSMAPVTEAASQAPRSPRATAASGPIIVSSTLPTAANLPAAAPQTARAKAEPEASSGGSRRKRKSSSEDISFDLAKGRASAEALRKHVTEEAIAQLEESSDLVDDKELKRQKRLLKNREAAHLSRLRKKKYVEDLEVKNEMLATELASLRERIAILESENASLRETIKLGGTHHHVPSSAKAVSHRSSAALY